VDTFLNEEFMKDYFADTAAPSAEAASSSNSEPPAIFTILSKDNRLLQK
jgi:hypothetical protein